MIVGISDLDPESLRGPMRAKVFLPERLWTQAVSVKGIDRIMFGGNEHHVVRAACNIA